MDPVTIATTFETFLGVQPSKVASAIYSAIKKIGDKKQRLAAIEIGALVGLAYHDRIMEVLAKQEGEVSPELFRARAEALEAALAAQRDIMMVFARVADLDGSVGE